MKIDRLIGILSILLQRVEDYLTEWLAGCKGSVTDSTYESYQMYINVHMIPFFKSMKLIQEWLGHSDISTTSNAYSHVDSESKKMSAKAIELALAENEPGKEGA